MSEFITVQIGQCGNQIGSQLWPLILQEYGINDVPGGVPRTDVNPSSDCNDSLHSFFSGCDEFDVSKLVRFADTKSHNLKARAVLVDMEDSVVDRFHSGPLRHLFDRRCTVRNYPGSGNNWAEGYMTHGYTYCDALEDAVRRTAEECDHLHGFLVMHSAGGGTGSGLGSYILELLENQFTSTERFVTCVYANGTEDVITCPYNMALATKRLTEFATCVFPVENRALLEIVGQQRRQKQCTDTMSHIVKCSPFQDMNSVVVNMLLGLTCGSRFSGSMNVDMSDISTNLIPFPKLQFISTGLSPLTVPAEKYKHHADVSSAKVKNEVFVDSCSKRNQLLKLDPLGLNSVVLGACVMGRGSFTVSDMRGYVERLQARARFTQWSTRAVRTGLCRVAPAGHNVSMLSMFNTSAMQQLFAHVLEQFHRLYSKRAHVHHYTRVAGFDVSFFDECQESLLVSAESYASTVNSAKQRTPRYQVI